MGTSAPAGSTACQGKRPDELEAGAATPLGVKLCSPDVAGRDRATKALPVLGAAGNDRPIVGHANIGMDEVEIRIGRHVRPQRGAGHGLDLVPAYVRHLDIPAESIHAS